MSELATNADVLARYGMSEIMKRAWRSFKTEKMCHTPISFSEALRKSWEGFRLAIDRIAADEAKREAMLQSMRGKSGLLGKIANDKRHSKENFGKQQGDEWGQGSSRYLNTVIGQ